ncbi:hypothetical protein [Sphingomonas sp.]|uniref:hypothetical protein n=1 Tax=Sphingomonas sp. TaxID=28214 RepID=UPI003B00899B
MASNTGIIFGQIRDQGAGVAGCDVQLNFVYGDASMGPIGVGSSGDVNGNVSGWVKGTTNKDGKFVLAFNWSGVDIAKVAEGRATASLYVVKWGENFSHRSFNTRTTLFLGLDLKKLIQVGYTDPTASATDFTNAAKDFYASYRDMLPAHGVFPTIMPFSTEVWGLIGKVSASLPA